MFTHAHLCFCVNRLFRLNTSISPKKFFQLISSQSLNISPLWKILTGRGQVFFSVPVCLYWIFFCPVCRSLHNYMLFFYYLSCISAVYFLYDLSPITVTIKEERRSFLHFITRLCAVLGGTFALTGEAIPFKWSDSFILMLYFEQLVMVDNMRRQTNAFTGFLFCKSLYWWKVQD